MQWIYLKHHTLQCLPLPRLACLWLPRNFAEPVNQQRLNRNQRNRCKWRGSRPYAQSCTHARMRACRCPSVLTKGQPTERVCVSIRHSAHLLRGLPPESIHEWWSLWRTQTKTGIQEARRRPHDICMPMPLYVGTHPSWSFCCCSSNPLPVFLSRWSRCSTFNNQANKAKGSACSPMRNFFLLSTPTAWETNPLLSTIQSLKGYPKCTCMHACTHE